MKTQIKTSELVGAQLEYYVAKAEGHTWRCIWMLGLQGMRAWQSYETAWGEPTPPYSTEWGVTGPLLAKYEIELNQCHNGNWRADGPTLTAYAATQLEAVCRLIVLTAFGHEVEEVK